MKYTKYLFPIGLIVLASGCAFNRPLVLQTAVGPSPFETGTGSPEGRLAVYSALDTGFSSDPDASTHHSDYRIYSADGKQLKYVHNWVGTFIEDPAVVSLAPGRYNVVARAAASGTVTVPIVIEAGKTTSVHLDGSKLADGRKTSDSALVRLPDGWIVGWRAKENEELK